jgi:amino acid permease
LKDLSTLSSYLTTSESVRLISDLGVAELTIFKEGLVYIYREFNPEIVEDPWFIRPWFTVAVCLGICLIPLIIVKKIEKLRFMALIGISAILTFVVLVVYNFFKESSDRDWDFSGLGLTAFPPSDEPFEAIAAIPNILLAFLYQMNFFPIYKGMKNSSDRKMLNASWTGCISCFFIYSSVSFLGYLTYGNAINKSNFLRFLNKEQIGEVLYLVINLVFLGSVLCSFPIIFFGARNNFIALFKVLRSAANKKDNHIRSSRFARSGIE